MNKEEYYKKNLIRLIKKSKMPCPYNIFKEPIRYIKWTFRSNKPVTLDGCYSPDRGNFITQVYLGLLNASSRGNRKDTTLAILEPLSINSIYSKFRVTCFTSTVDEDIVSGKFKTKVIMSIV